MAEFFLTMFIFVGVMAVTVLVFGGWVLVNVMRGLFGMFGGSSRRPASLPPQSRVGPAPWRPMQQNPLNNFSNFSSPGAIQCGVPGCRRLNPAGARFCRRCGHAFPQQQHVSAVRRVAV